MKPFILRFAQRFGISRSRPDAPGGATHAAAPAIRTDPERAPRLSAETRFTKVDRETTDDD